MFEKMYETKCSLCGKVIELGHGIGKLMYKDEKHYLCKTCYTALVDIIKNSFKK